MGSYGAGGHWGRGCWIWTPQCSHVPMLVPAVTDSRDQPSQATEVVTTRLLTIEQESKCAAAASPAWGSMALGESLHIPRAHPMPPGLLPCPQRSSHVPSAQSMPQELSHIPRDHITSPGFTPCSQGVHPMMLKGSSHISRDYFMLTVLTPSAAWESPHVPSVTHITSTHPVSPGAQLTSPWSPHALQGLPHNPKTHPMPTRVCPTPPEGCTQVSRGYPITQRFTPCPQGFAPHPQGVTP